MLLTKRLPHFVVKLVALSLQQLIGGVRLWNWRHGFKLGSWHVLWLWANHLHALVFGVFLCKIKIKILYTIPTSQGCCENQVKRYVKALCKLCYFLITTFPMVLPPPYQIQYDNLPEGCTLTLQSPIPCKGMVHGWSTCPPRYLVPVWKFWCLTRWQR